MWPQLENKLSHLHAYSYCLLFSCLEFFLTVVGSDYLENNVRFSWNSFGFTVSERYYRSEVEVIFPETAELQAQE